MNISEIFLNIFSYIYGFHSFTRRSSEEYFQEFPEKPLKSSKYRGARKSRNIFISRYGIKTADSAAGVLFVRCSQENAISSRWKSL